MGQRKGEGSWTVWGIARTPHKLSVIAKRLHDVDHKNRIKGDYEQLMLAYQFYSQRGNACVSFRYDG